MTLHREEQSNPSPLEYPSRADAYLYKVRRQEVEELLEEHPQLHALGHGIPRGATFDFHAARAELLHPSIITRIGFARCWIAHNLVPNKRNSRHNRSSYYWKHVMQRDTTLYLLSGAFTTAALLSDIPVSLGHFNATLYARRAPLPANTTQGTP